MTSLPTWQRFAILILAAAALAAGLDLLITTDKEEIEGTLDRLSEQAVRRNAEEMLGAVAPDFSQEGFDRTALLDAARKILAEFPPRSLEWIQREITTDGAEAKARLRVRFLPAPECRFPYPFDSVWALAFTERAGRWQITRIDPLEIGGQKIDTLAGALRQAR